MGLAKGLLKKILGWAILASLLGLVVYFFVFMVGVEITMQIVISIASGFAFVFLLALGLELIKEKLK